MKKSMKVSLIVAAAVFTAGVIISGAAFLLNRGMPDVDNSEAKNAQFKKGITTIETDLGLNDIVVKYGDQDEISVDYYETDRRKIICQEDDNVLTVKNDNGDLFWLDYMNIGFPLDKHYSVTISVPKDYSGKLNLHTSMGEVSVEGIKTDKDLKIETSTGNVSVNNCEFDEIEITTATGDKKIQNTTGADIVMSSSTGKATVENVKAKSLMGNSSTGDYMLSDCEISSNMTISASTGRIEQEDVSVKGVVDLKTSTGDIYLEEFLVEKEFFAETTMGNITAEMIDNGLFVNNCHTNMGTTNLPVFKGDEVPINVVTTMGDIVIKFAKD